MAQAKGLIIFDIDGTLTNTYDIDLACFTETLISIMGKQIVSADPADFNSSTDSGLIIEIFQMLEGRPPLDEEVTKIQSHFFAALEEKLQTYTVEDIIIPGALDIFNEITKLGTWSIAIATGAWHKSAKLKLSHAGLPFQNIPLASADDARSREEIILIAGERARRAYKQQHYQHHVYVGDRSWDYQAAKTLGYHFIGIGAAFENNANGIPVYKHYQDHSRFIEHLTSIASPA